MRERLRILKAATAKAEAKLAEEVRLEEERTLLRELLEEERAAKEHLIATSERAERLRKLRLEQEVVTLMAEQAPIEVSQETTTTGSGGDEAVMAQEPVQVGPVQEPVQESAASRNADGGGGGGGNGAGDNDGGSSETGEPPGGKPVGWGGRGGHRGSGRSGRGSRGGRRRGGQRRRQQPRKSA